MLLEWFISYYVLYARFYANTNGLGECAFNRMEPAL